jgi:hypothetical protein
LTAVNFLRGAERLYRRQGRRSVTESIRLRTIGIAVIDPDFAPAFGD